MSVSVKFEHNGNLVQADLTEGKETLTVEGVKYDLRALTQFLLGVHRLWYKFWSVGKTPGMLQIPGLWRDLMSDYRLSMKSEDDKEDQ